MLLKLIRKQPQGNAICGELLIDNRWFCSTLERTDVAIPAGFYPVTLTMSPCFGEVLPLIGNVVGRTGIRIPAGNYPRDTAGCILVGVASTGDADASSADSTHGIKGKYPSSPQPRLLSSRRTLCKLRDILLTNYNDRKTKRYEPVYIKIIDPDPYPLYDVPCPLEQRMHYIEAQRAAREYTRGDTVYLDRWRDRWHERVVIRTDTVYQDKEIVVHSPPIKYVPRIVKWLSYIGAAAIIIFLLWFLGRIYSLIRR